MLILTEKQVEELNALIQELPTKYGVTIINLFRKFVQDNEPKTESKVPEQASNNLKIAEIEAE